ncbi:MAG: peptidoglycan-binding protein [Bryobacteraceae bacterium]
MSANIVLFPGREILAGEKDHAVVTAVQRRLNELGCGPLQQDGSFGPATSAAVGKFQSQHGLKVTGSIAEETWVALFGGDPSDGTLLNGVLREARSQVGVMEKPLGSNRGPEVDQYLLRVGLNPTAGSYPWCAAFVYYCFDEASKALSRTNPVIRTAGALDLWRKSCATGVPHLTAAVAAADPSKIQPGFIFVMSTGGGNGHVGLVESSTAGKLVTIEGNTNTNGSREGIGVFRRDSRRVSQINQGFLDYSNS